MFFQRVLKPAVLMMQEAAGAPVGARVLDLDPANGERLKLADKSFELVTSRWTLPSYSNVDAILREVSRVLAPGGRFAVVLPGREEKCSLLTTPYKSAARQKVAVKDALTPYRFSVPGAFELMLGSTGFAEAWTHRYGVTITFAKPELYWELFFSADAPFKKAFDGWSKRAQSAIMTELGEALEAKRTSLGIELPLELVIGIGSVSGGAPAMATTPMLEHEAVEVLPGVKVQLKYISEEQLLEAEAFLELDSLEVLEAKVAF